MSFFSKIRGTYETIFQIGKAGPQVKNSSGVVEMRDSADAAYAITRGLDPVGAQDYVTKNHFDTFNAASEGIMVVSMPLALATKVSVGTIPDNCTVIAAWLDVTSVYDASTLWAIARTGGGASIMLTADNDPENVNIYHVPQITSWGSTGAGTVTATITGTPAAGAAVLYIACVTPTDIT